MASICLTVFILLLLICFCQSDDQLTSARPLSPGDLLISKNGVFALGFFSPVGSNESMYAGIWFHGIPEHNRTIVWVANRDNPAKSTAASPAKLAITHNQGLVLSDTEGRRTLWTTAANITAGVGVAVAVPLNSGSFVLRSANGTVLLWQSFDHPTPTMLPTMKVKGRVPTC